MPTGVYPRQPGLRRPNASAAHLALPENQAKAAAARKISRPRVRGYAAVGRHGEPLVHVHRLRAERALGRPLPPGVEVHHSDGSKRPDGPLVICPDHAYHALLHVRMRTKSAGGDPNTQKVCSRCRAVKDKTEFNRNRSHLSDGLDYFCRECIRQKNAIQTARHKRLRYSATAVTT